VLDQDNVDQTVAAFAASQEIPDDARQIDKPRPTSARGGGRDEIALNSRPPSEAGVDIRD